MCMTRTLTMVLVLASLLVAGLAQAQYNYYTTRPPLQPLLRPFSNPSSSASAGGFYYFGDSPPPINTTRGNVLPPGGPGSISALNPNRTAKPTAGPNITYKDLFGPGGKLEYNPAPPAGTSYLPVPQDIISSHRVLRDQRSPNNYEWTPPVIEPWQVVGPYPPQAYGNEPFSGSVAGTSTTPTAPPPSNVYPTLYLNNRVYVAVRDYFASLGVVAYWDKSTRSAVATLPDGRKVVLPLDSSKITVDGKTVELGAPVVEANEVLMVPLQDLSEALGVKLTVDPQTNRVYLTLPPPSSASSASATDNKPTAPATQQPPTTTPTQ
jgi:hypothetical protein